MGQRRPWSDDHHLTRDEIARDVALEASELLHEPTDVAVRCAICGTLVDDREKVLQWGHSRRSEIAFCGDFHAEVWRQQTGSLWWAR